MTKELDDLRMSELIANPLLFDFVNEQIAEQENEVKAQEEVNRKIEALQEKEESLKIAFFQEVFKDMIEGFAPKNIDYNPYPAGVILTRHLRKPIVNNGNLVYEINVHYPFNHLRDKPITEAMKSLNLSDEKIAIGIKQHCCQFLAQLFPNEPNEYSDYLTLLAQEHQRTVEEEKEQRQVESLKNGFLSKYEKSVAFLASRGYEIEFTSYLYEGTRKEGIGYLEAKIHKNGQFATFWYNNATRCGHDVKETSFNSISTTLLFDNDENFIKFVQNNVGTEKTNFTL